MPGENWQQIRTIFDDALEQPPEGRARFVDEICGDDEVLLGEVRSLLFALQSADSFMETPAVTRVADMIEAETKKLEEGTCFGHYEIIEQIGSGGMGAVYLAKDNKLDREVAVKILDEKLALGDANPKRFTQEAKAASSLNHPNILVIHEIGESEGAHYIVSEFIKGKTLREICREKPLRLSEVLDISSQIANALCAAHEARIIHRDIKPENIMVRPDGVAKILDFGLAKLVERKDRSIFNLKGSTQNQTAKGTILGTVNYMSPEQAKAERVDERSDIFSFGVLIYEMIAGRTPFAGDSNSETFANLINSEPKGFDPHASNIPDEMRQMIFKMLCKDPNGRYQAMKDVLTQLKDLKEDLALDARMEHSYSLAASETRVLRGTTGGEKKSTADSLRAFSQSIKRHKPVVAFALIGLIAGATVLIFYFYKPTNAAVVDKRSIAVLPPKALRAEDRDPSYELGIADSLIFKIGSAKGIIVRSLSAMGKYTDIGQDPIAAGREQKVDYVLASNYQIADGKIRITSQLINVQSGQVEDSFKVEQENSTIFAVQDAVAANIGGPILKRLNRESNDLAEKRYTTNEEAYRLYIQGTILVGKRTQESSRKAIEYLEQAVGLDPNYALAYARLGHAYNTLVYTGGSKNWHEDYLKAKAAIERALAIDPNLAEAHSFLGEMKINYDADLAGAEEEHKLAVALNPNSSTAHGMYAILLGYFGRFDEAVAESKTAIDLEPATQVNHHTYGYVLWLARRCDEAITEEERVVETDTETFFPYNVLTNCYRLKGDDDKAFEAFVHMNKPEETDELKAVYAKSGWRGISEHELEYWKAAEKKGNRNYNQLAQHSIELGQNEEAFAYLEKAFVEDRSYLVSLKVNPRYDPLRSDPRFDDLLSRMGLK